MAIAFHPKPGMVLMCNFDGYVAPEIIKTRPVVVISPSHLSRPGLVTVVPLSTTKPNPIEAYHYCLKSNPVPGADAKIEVWAKCDLVATVRAERLDRVKIERGRYEVGYISMSQVKAIRLGILASIGVDLANPSTYTP